MSDPISAQDEAAPAAKPAPRRASLIAAQLLLAAIFAALFFAPRVWLRARADDPDAVTFRWRSSDFEEVEGDPRVVPLADGYGVRLGTNKRRGLALYEPRLDRFPLHNAFTVTVVVEPSKAPPRRGVALSAVLAERSVLELGINKDLRAYVELNSLAGRKVALTGESKRKLKERTHLTAVYVPGERLSLYLDGALAVEQRGKKLPRLRKLKRIDWSVANRQGHKKGFRGIVGPICVYPRALSEAEIQAQVVREGLEVVSDSLPPKILTKP